jgi:hypothetical protein
MCDTRALQRSSAAMTGHGRKRSAYDIRTPEGHEARLVETGIEGKPRASRLDRLLLGNLRAKKLPYRGDSKQAIAENLAHQATEDGATDDGDAQDGEDDTG